MEDLNQLYSKALGAFSQAAGLTPQQSQMTSGMQGVAGRINQNPNIRGGMNPVGWTGTGIATIPQGGSTLGSRSPGQTQSAPPPIPPSMEMGSDASITMARRDQANDMGVLLGTDIAASEAAGRDISGWGKNIYSPYNDPNMSNADWVKAMKALQAKVDAGNATPEEIQLLNKTSGVWNMPSLIQGGTTGTTGGTTGGTATSGTTGTTGIQQGPAHGGGNAWTGGSGIYRPFNEGGIVSLDYLTRRL